MAKLFTSRLRFDLVEKIENGDNLEIEARLRKLSDKQIALLIQYLEENNIKKQTSFTIDYYLDGNKRITQEGDKFFIIDKKNIFSKLLFVPNKDIKISVAYESKPSPTEEPTDYILKRIKDRTSYIEEKYRIDITKIEENGQNRTEVELEVLDSKNFNVDDFEAKINSIYELISVNNEEVAVFLNTKIANHASKDLKLLYGFISRPRDLIIRDLTKDGLLQNYSISVKADGLQKMMIFYHNYIYLFSLIDNDIDKSFTLLSKYDNKLWDNTVIIGELVDKKNHQYESEYIYLPFDCLIYQNEDIRRKNYLDRLKHINDFYSQVFNTTEIIEKKIFTYENNEISFYEANNIALNTEKEVKYVTDGLIFTPINSPYITSGQKLSSKSQINRILSSYPDVCKFKPPEKLTIDFLVKEEGLYSKEGKFTGDNKFPFTSDNYTFDKKYIDKIVEFEPKEINGEIIYHPLRIRLDKTFPNKTKQIMDNWYLIHDPITTATLRGNNLQLLRKYHNQIKGDLLNQIKGYVIDIGAGAGGVFNKYTANNKIKQVLSIEPNKEFGKEFERRRNKLKKPEQFKLIEGGGEDTKLIIKAAEDFFPSNFDDDINICFHISLSFFWQSKEILTELANTIIAIEKFYQERNGKGKVRIVYLTIEGSRLKNLFDTKGNTVTLNNVLLRRMENDKIFIDIKDSVTVHNQIEYLVYLSQLWTLINFKPLFEKEADNQNKNGYILSSPEFIYSNLFVYGIAEKGDFEAPRNDKIKPSEDICLVVDEKIGNKTKYGIQAKGDDERQEIKKNFYRLATLNTHGKIYHSLLKLLSTAYREGDVYKRVKLAEDLNQKLRSSQDLDYISKRLNIGIKIINKDEIFGKDKERFILFYDCNNGYYEPVVYNNKKDHMIFGSESCILA